MTCAEKSLSRKWTCAPRWRSHWIACSASQKLFPEPLGPARNVSPTSPTYSDSRKGEDPPLVAWTMQRCPAELSHFGPLHMAVAPENMRAQCSECRIGRRTLA